MNNNNIKEEVGLSSPTLMFDMRITSYKNLKIDQRILDEEFKEKLISFIDQLENQNNFDSDLYSALLGYDINQREFQNMIRAIQIFAFDDDDKDEINFPYEQWMDKISKIWYLV